MLDRLPYQDALRRTGLPDRLHRFDPQVVGTLPLGIAVPGSDIDIICHAPDTALFADALWAQFRDHAGFALYQWSAGGRPVIARFEAEGWSFEIYGSRQPVREQAGWRHFEVERRLLTLGGERLRLAVVAWREKGAKTEPAFASVLRLAGDPYAALLALHDEADEALAARLVRAGFRAA